MLRTTADAPNYRGCSELPRMLRTTADARGGAPEGHADGEEERPQAGRVDSAMPVPARHRLRQRTKPIFAQLLFVDDLAGRSAAQILVFEILLPTIHFADEVQVCPVEVDLADQAFRVDVAALQR